MLWNHKNGLAQGKRNDGYVSKFGFNIEERKMSYDLILTRFSAFTK